MSKDFDYDEFVKLFPKKPSLRQKVYMLQKMLEAANTNIFKLNDCIQKLYSEKKELENKCLNCKLLSDKNEQDKANLQQKPKTTIL